jgi:hypothetical protein
MTNEQMKKRVEKILTLLPRTDYALQASIRYGGVGELQEKILEAVKALEELDQDLERRGNETLKN